MATVTVCFTVDSNEDRDLVRWMDGLTRGKRSLAIREILRKGLKPECSSATLDDVYQVLKELEHKMQSGTVAARVSPSSEEWDEPPEAAAALDVLAKL